MNILQNLRQAILAVQQYIIHRVAAFSLLILPLLAVAIYMLELRIQAQFIARVEVKTQQSKASLSGLDKAVANQAAYLWHSSLLRQQIITPKPTVKLNKFHIDKYEVSQGNYRKFLGWLALQNTQRYSYSHSLEPQDYIYTNPYTNHKILGRLDIPVSGISFYEAYAYCKAAGGSLPTAAQWMATAAGKEARSYPWGEEFIATPWRYNDPILNLAAPEENRKKNATPQGVFDLGNGLSEWTLDIIEDGRAIQKGGNNYNRPFILQALNFIERATPLDFRSKYSGFRCSYPSDSLKNVHTNAKASFIQLSWQASVPVVLIDAGSYPQGIAKSSYAPKLLKNIEYSNPNTIKTFLSTALNTNNPAINFGKYEISRAEYRNFLYDPLARLGFYANSKEPRFHSYIPNNWAQQKKNLKLPVVEVDWWSAYAFAKWAGGRLPTEEEWLQVFSAGKTTAYVWGNDYISGISHIRDISANFFPTEPIAINSQKNDINNKGLIAMAGNVSEWTSSIEPYNNRVNIIVKGGNYKSPAPIAAHYSYNAKVPPNHRSEAIGIRVVFD